MATNPNRKAKPVKKNSSMNGAMDFLITGGLAELYLLVLRSYYVQGSAVQQIAWYDTYLKLFIALGAVLLVAGAVLTRKWREDKKKKSAAIMGLVLGAFLAVSSGLVWASMESLTLLMAIVPIVMLLCIIWCLYDRECALALTVLAISLVAVWLCQRLGGSLLLKAGVVVYIVALLAVIALAKAEKLTCLLPVKNDRLPVYVSCGLSAVALAASLLGAGIAYYALWVLAAVVFALAVYYTVKQL